VPLSQIVLVVVCTIPAGIIIGVLVSYLVFRFIDNYSITPLTVFRVLFARGPKTISSSRLASPSDEKHKVLPAIQEQSIPPPVVKEPPRILETVEVGGGESLLRLLAELKSNYKRAKEFSGDSLVPLLTDVWDASQHTLRNLHDNLRNDLERIYDDIGLLNHLVWFSSEFHSHSPSLHEQYVKVLMSIGDRLDKIVSTPLSHFTSEE
jgi:hypothetical protein